MTSLLEQLPLLLVLSPAIGFVVTLAATRFSFGLVRQLAIANVACSLLIVSVAVWHFETERSAEAIARSVPVEQDDDPKIAAAEQEAVHRKVDRQHAERLAHKPFVIDGTNLWAAVVLVLLTGVIVWRGESATNDSRWFLPAVLLFQATALGALTAYDLRVYLITYQSAVVIMSGLLGVWGGPRRRTVAERFFVVQFCGSALVMLGFAMLVMAVPWMKIEDSPKLPNVLFNIAAIVYELRKWMTGNELSFQYANEALPLIVLILSIGFSIQFGLFPFHSNQIAILSGTPRSVAALMLCSLSMASCLGWFRFVVPLAPELLSGLLWMMLVPLLAGTTWIALRSLAPGDRRQKLAFLYAALTNLSLLGVYAMSRAGMCGAWLMQQQLTIGFCWLLLAFETPAVNRLVSQPANAANGASSLRPMLFVLAITCFGLFACGAMMSAELLYESLFFLFCLVLTGSLVLLCVVLLLLSWNQNDEQGIATDSLFTIKPFQRSLLAVMLLAVVCNLFPAVMLRQCEPEFARVFRQFEQTGSATFAQSTSHLRQTSP